MKHKETIIPIEWESWDEFNILAAVFYNATFTENFGVFNKDEKFSSVAVDYSNGFIEAYSEDGENVVKYQKFITTPI